MYIDKKEIILAQIDTCERLLNCFKGSITLIAINKELVDLKASLNLMKYYKIVLNKGSYNYNFAIISFAMFKTF